MPDIHDFRFVTNQVKETAEELGISTRPVSYTHLRFCNVSLLIFQSSLIRSVSIESKQSSFDASYIL